jgi:hypothetical protein
MNRSNAGRYECPLRTVAIGARHGQPVIVSAGEVS